MMSAIDDWLMDRVTAAYLWVYDRTGVYVGTIMTLASFMVGSAIVMRMVERERSSIVNDIMLVWILIMLYWSRKRWSLQNRRSVAAYNAQALSDRESVIRPFVPPLVLLFIAIDIRTAPWDLLFDLGFFVYIYCETILIRDREPPESRSMVPQT